jgi:hypothetical protein
MKREPLKALINATQLLKESVGTSQSHDINGIISEEVEGLVEGKAKLIRIGQGVLVQCKLNAEVELVCSRCLDAFLCPISFTAEEEFVPISDVSGDLALSSPEQSEDFTIDDILCGTSIYPYIDARNFSDQITLTVKIYTDNTKTTFKMGYKITDLSPTKLSTGAVVEDYDKADNSLESDNFLVTPDESEL